jgi:hypothetical protein
MKVIVAVAAMALLLALPAPAAAQTGEPGATRLVEDPAGDVKVTVQGTPADPGGHWAATDLKSLDVVESVDDFTFTLGVAALKPSSEVPLLETSQYDIQFLHHDRVFDVFLFRQVIQTATYGAYLSAYDPALDRYDQLSGFVAPTVDEGAATMQVAFARDLFLDHAGNAPHPEVPFTGWHVQARGGFQIGGGNSCIASACFPSPEMHVSDAMPDQGNATLDLAIRFGIQQSGRARLASENPTRSSNGEATTFVYQVEAISAMAGNETFQLAASGLPAGWEAKLPAQHILVPGNSSVLFPVLLTVPFAHAHGTYQKFLLELRSQSDPGSVGRIQLGVRFSNPPQPAGHHNTLWLHAQASTNDPTFGAVNTVFGGGEQLLYMNAASSSRTSSLPPSRTCGASPSPPPSTWAST